MAIYKWLKRKIRGGAAPEDLAAELAPLLADAASRMGPWQFHMGHLCQASFVPMASVKKSVNYGLLNIFPIALRGGEHESMCRDDLIRAIPEDVSGQAQVAVEVLKNQDLRDQCLEASVRDGTPYIVEVLTAFRILIDEFVGPPPEDHQLLRGYFLTAAEIVFATGLLISQHDAAFTQLMLEQDF